MGLFPKKRFYTPSVAVASSGGGGSNADTVIYENWNAVGGGYPPTFKGGAIPAFAHYIITGASVADGNGDIKFPLGAILLSLAAAPGQVDASWKIMQI